MQAFPGVETLMKKDVKDHPVLLGIVKKLLASVDLLRNADSTDNSLRQSALLQYKSCVIMMWNLKRINYEMSLDEYKTSDAKPVIDVVIDVSPKPIPIGQKIQAMANKNRTEKGLCLENIAFDDFEKFSARHVSPRCGIPCQREIEGVEKGGGSSQLMSSEWIYNPSSILLSHW
jgi:hypothetical protein